MMRASPAAVARHARDLRTLSIVSDLRDWIDHAADQARGRSPEAELARLVHDRLIEFERRLEPVIERLAIAEAEREAQVEAEIAEYEQEAM